MAYDKLLMIDEVGRIFTAKAAGSITAGDLVMWASGADCVGSGNSTYNWDDVAILRASGTAGTAHESTLGISLGTGNSGTELAIAMQGLFILPAGSNGVSGGQPVVFVGYSNCVEKIGTGSLAAANYPIGRALTGASSEANLALIRLDV